MISPSNIKTKITDVQNDKELSPFLYTRPKDVPRTYHKEEDPERSFFIFE